MNCVICNIPFDNLIFDRRRVTCSSECSHENARRKRRRKENRRNKRKAYLQSLARKRGKRCRTCNIDISRRRGNARYCSKKCFELGYQAPPRPPQARFCQRCSEPVPKYRRLCDGCRKPRESGWSPVKAELAELPFDKRMEVKERQAQSRQKMKKRIRAANELYRELMGLAPKNEKSVQQSPPPPPLCVVCGIFITGWRKRVLCSKACAEARARERSSCRYYDDPLPVTPRMIATREWTADRGAGKFRSHRRRQYTPWTEPWTEQRRMGARANSRHRNAVYAAMRELNLIEGEDGL